MRRGVSSLIGVLALAAVGCGAPTISATPPKADSSVSAQVGDSSTGVGRNGVAEIVFDICPSVGISQLESLKAAVTVSTLSHVSVPFSIEPAPPRSRVSGCSQFAVRVERPSDEWFFAGFTQIPQPLHSALPNLDGFGTGVRVSTTLKPTPTYFTMCPHGANQSGGTIHFSNVVQIPPGAVSLTLNGTACAIAASLSSSASFTCGPFRVDQTHMRVTIGSGITCALIPAEPLELINGAQTLDVSLDATSAIPQSDGCYDWRLQ